MRQIVALLVAVGVFALTFVITALLADYDMTVKVAGVTLKSTIPGVVLAATFGALSYRGSNKG